MSELAFANGFSQITCTDGSIGASCGSDPSRWHWDTPTIQTTSTTSNTKVFVEGKLVAVEGDAMISHPDGVPCVTAPVNHSPTTSLVTGKIFIGGKRAVCVGSKYNTGTPFDHTVSTGSSKVSYGGPLESV